MCQKLYEHNLHIGGPIGIMLRANSLLTFDCHCNQLLDRTENMDNWGQETMEYFQNGYEQELSTIWW